MLPYILPNFIWEMFLIILLRLFLIWFFLFVLKCTSRNQYLETQVRYDTCDGKECSMLRALTTEKKKEFFKQA